MGPGFESLIAYKEEGGFRTSFLFVRDRDSGDLFLVYFVNTLPTVAWRPSGTALTLRVRPNTKAPAFFCYSGAILFFIQIYITRWGLFASAHITPRLFRGLLPPHEAHTPRFCRLSRDGCSHRSDDIARYS